MPSHQDTCRLQVPDGTHQLIRLHRKYGESCTQALQRVCAEHHVPLELATKWQDDQECR